VSAPVPVPPDAALVNAASPKVLAMGPASAKEIVWATGGGGGEGGGGELLPPPPQLASSTTNDAPKPKRSPEINDMTYFPAVVVPDGDLGRLLRA